MSQMLMNQMLENHVDGLVVAVFDGGEYLGVFNKEKKIFLGARYGSKAHELNIEISRWFGAANIGELDEIELVGDVTVRTRKLKAKEVRIWKTQFGRIKYIKEKALGMLENAIFFEKRPFDDEDDE